VLKMPAYYLDGPAQGSDWGGKAEIGTELAIVLGSTGPRTGPFCVLHS
jgi:hypothetical protein